MPYTNILEKKGHSIADIKDFNIAARQDNGDVITFPLDVIFDSDFKTIQTNVDFDNRTIKFNSETSLIFRNVMPNFVEYNEEEVEDRRGLYYRKTLNFSIPKLNLTTQNQIKEFLFDAADQFSINGIVLFFTDSNNQKWLANYSIPFILQEFEENSGARNEGNEYTFTFECTDYYRSTKYNDKYDF